MNATSLDIQWADVTWQQERLTSALVRNITTPKPEMRCPACDSIVYTRRHKLCGVCGEELPKELLFPARIAARLKFLVGAEQEKHRTWVKRRMAAEDRRPGAPH